MKSRLLKLIFAMSMTGTVLSACGSEDASSGGSSNEEGTGQEVTIDFFNLKLEIKEQLEDLAAAYEEENPGVNINVQTSGGSEGPDLQARFASGDEPAIFMLGGLPEVERYQNYLADLSDTEAVQTAIEGTTDGSTIDGVTYGIPMNIEGFAWMINKDLFNQAGVDPASIQSYDDFVNAVETLDSQKEELGLEAVFGFSAAEDWVVNQYSGNFTSPEFDNSISTAYNATELNWEYGNRMQEYTDLMNQYNVQPILTVDYSTSVEELFVNGQVAIVHQGNWIVPTLNSLDSEFAQEKLGILPFYVDSDTEGRVNVGPPWYVVVNKNLDENVVEEATAFLEWMYTSEEGRTALVEDFQFIPSHEGFDVESISDPVSQEIYQALLDGNTAAMVHNQYPDGFYSEVLFPEFQRYLDGDSSWDQFESTTSEQFSQMR